MTRIVLAAAIAASVFAVEAQIDTLDLMSNARDLPLQTADGAF